MPQNSSATWNGASSEPDGGSHPVRDLLVADQRAELLAGQLRVVRLARSRPHRRRPRRWPERDALAVWQAPPTDDPGAVAIESRNSWVRRVLPTPAPRSGSPCDRLGPRPRSRTRRQMRHLRLTADHGALVAPARRVGRPDGQEPVGGDGLRLALEHEGLDLLDLGEVANEGEGRRRRAGPRLRRAACSRRAATLTASPVTRR